MPRRSPTPIERAAALHHLAVTEDSLYVAPQITPQLRLMSQTLRRAGQPRVTRRVLSGNHVATIEENTEHAVPYGMGTNLTISWSKYLEIVDDPVASAVLSALSSVPKHLQHAVPIEAYCLAARASPVVVLELIRQSVVRMAATASSIISAINHPRVVEKTVEMALTDDGIADRTLLHKATGFLPTPKGPSQTVTVVASANAQAASVAAPPPESTIRRMVDRFNDARPAALPLLSAVEIPVPSRELEPVAIDVDADEDE